VNKYYSKAIEYFQLSSQQGNSVAQYNLGYMYLNGYGVNKDYSKAIELYKLAAQNGDEDAKKILIELGELTTT